MQLQPDVGLVLGEYLNAVDVAEVGQQGHQVGPGVDDMADAITGAHEQNHIRLFLPLLRRVQSVATARSQYKTTRLKFHRR